MKKRLLSALMAALLCLAAVPAASAAGDWIAAEHTKDNGSPYYIMVNRPMNTVTVYTLGEDGYYSVPFKAMVCSTGQPGHETPCGTFAITGAKMAWCYMVDGNYGQYACRFNGHVLFHSVCYSGKSPSSLIIDEYNQLGTQASLGCVRLQVADAKWIYDNCPVGTGVTVYNGTTPGALGKPAPLVDKITPELDNGWEPTDPRANNPWKNMVLQSVALEETELQLMAGEQASLTPKYTPAEAVWPADTLWTSSAPAVAEVDASGRVTAMGQGAAEITLSRGGHKTVCTVTVEGSLLPFDDVKPGAWYYAAVRHAYENGTFSGASETSFAPDVLTSRAMAVQLMYNLAKEGPEDAENTGSAEDSDPWYADALAWGVESGLLEGMSAQNFQPERAVTRQEFAVLLHRMDALREGSLTETEADLTAFKDGDSIFAFAEEPLAWTVANGILQGTPEGEIRPADPLSRAELAGFLYNYFRARNEL